MFTSLFVCFFVLAGVVPSLDTNNDEVGDVLYRVQAMRLADAPRPRNTTPGAGKGEVDLHCVTSTVSNEKNQTMWL